MEKFIRPLRKYAEFQGRAGREEYWLWVLAIIIVEVIFYALIGVTGGFNGSGGGNAISMILTLLLGAFGLAIFIPSLAVAFRRLHDTDRSAWWLLIGLVPFIGGIVLLIFYILPGTPGPNKFGPDPKGASTPDVFS